MLSLCAVLAPAASISTSFPGLISRSFASFSEASLALTCLCEGFCPRSSVFRTTLSSIRRFRKTNRHLKICVGFGLSNLC